MTVRKARRELAVEGLAGCGTPQERSRCPTAAAGEVHVAVVEWQVDLSFSAH